MVFYGMEPGFPRRFMGLVLGSKAGVFRRAIMGGPAAEGKLDVIYGSWMQLKNE